MPHVEGFISMHSITLTWKIIMKQAWQWYEKNSNEQGKHGMSKAIIMGMD